jgi:HrpA-like RNA helicase
LEKVVFISDRMQKFDLKSLVGVKVRADPEEEGETRNEIKPLQILKYREEILNKINSSPVTIISAATGSGKVNLRF